MVHVHGCRGLHKVDEGIEILSWRVEEVVHDGFVVGFLPQHGLYAGLPGVRMWLVVEEGDDVEGEEGGRVGCHGEGALGYGET